MMDRSGRLFSLGISSTGISRQATATSFLSVERPQPYLNLARDEVSVKLQEAARVDPDVVDVVLAADLYGIPSRVIDQIGVEDESYRRQAFSIGTGLTSEVVQHTLVPEQCGTGSPSPGTMVALKIFRSTKQASPNKAKAARQKVYDSILKEMKAFSHPSLSNHPHVLKLLFIGWNESQAFPFLAIELGDYGSLDYIIRAPGPGPTVQQKRHITIDIALGLQAIHHAGFIHGDLKPDNIIVFSHEDPTRQVVAKLTDFGGSDNLDEQLAWRPTHFTPLWCAPEVLAKDPEIFWDIADMYSYGLVVASLWAGRESVRTVGKEREDDDYDENDELSSSSVLYSFTSSLTSDESEEGLKYLKSLPEDHPDSLMSVLEERLTRESLPAGIDPNELFAILRPTLKTDWWERPDRDDFMAIISDFARTIGRDIVPLTEYQAFEIYEPKPMRLPVLQRDVNLYITSIDYRDAITKHLSCALDEINARMEYIPQVDDIPDHLPKNLSTEQFLTNLLAKTEKSLTSLYDALGSDSKDDLWPAVIDFIKRGYFLYTLGASSLISVGSSSVPGLKKRGLEYLRASALHENDMGILEATFTSSKGLYKSEIPVRLNLTLLALSHSSLALRCLQSSWPDLHSIVRKILRERGLSCLDEARSLFPGLYESRRLVTIYCAQAGPPISAQLQPLRLLDALEIGAAESVRALLDGAEMDVSSDMEQSISSLLHKLCKLPDVEAAALARTMFERGAKLDCRLHFDIGDLPAAAISMKAKTPLCTALARGQPALAMEIFCLHVEFDIPLTQFSTATVMSFVNLYPAVGEALLMLFRDNPTMCVDLDGGDFDYLLHLAEVSMARAMAATMCLTIFPVAKTLVQPLHGGGYEAAYTRTLEFLLKEGGDPTSGQSGFTPLGLSIVTDDIIALKLCIDHMEKTYSETASGDLDDMLVASLIDPCNLASITESVMGPTAAKLSGDWRYEYTALALCLRHSSLRCFEFLLARVPSLAMVEVDIIGRSLLHRACSGVNHMINAFPFGICGILDDPTMLCPIAMRPGLQDGPGVEFVDMLLAAGADVMATDSSDFTPLYWALWRVNIAAADRIASHCSQDQLNHLLGRDPYTGHSIFEALIKTDVTDVTIEHVRQPRLLESLQWLAERGAIHFYGSGDLAVWHIILSSKPCTLRTDERLDAALMEYLVDLPLFAERLHTDRLEGYSLLHVAVTYGNLEIVRLLLDRDFDPNVHMDRPIQRRSHMMATPLDLIPQLLVNGPLHGMEKASKLEFRKWQDRMLDIASLLLDRGARGEEFEYAQQHMDLANRALDGSIRSREVENFLQQYRDPGRPAETLRQQAILGAWPMPLPSECDAAIGSKGAVGISTPLDPATDFYLYVEILRGAFRRFREKREGRVRTEKPLLLVEGFYTGAFGDQALGGDSGEAGRGNVSSGEAHQQDRSVTKENKESQPQRGTSQLHIALEQGDVSGLTAALDGAEDIETADTNGYSPLVCALLIKPTDIRRAMVQLLLEAGADPNRIGSPLPKIARPLHHCIMHHDDTYLVKVLVAAGADINLVDSDKQTPLMLAAALGREATLAFLLSAGADITPQNADGQSLLHIAIVYNQPRILSRLLAFVSNAPAGIDQTRRAEGGKEGGGSDRNIQGRTPLHFAAHEGNISAMRILINQGMADPDVKDESGRTPLHHAVVDATVETAEMLIDEAGADINARDIDQETPLVKWAMKYMLGKWEPNLPMRDLLVARGANVDVLKEFRFFLRIDGELGCFYVHVSTDTADELVSTELLSKATGAPWVECDLSMVLDARY